VGGLGLARFGETHLVVLAGAVAAEECKVLRICRCFEQGWCTLNGVKSFNAFTSSPTLELQIWGLLRGRNRMPNSK